MYFYIIPHSDLTSPVSWPLPLRRPGVSMGTQAVRGGGGGAVAPARRADDRQRLPGGLVRGGVLLRPLGE